MKLTYLLFALLAVTAFSKTVEIEAGTDHAVLAWRVENDGTLNQRHLGAKPATGNAQGSAYPAFNGGGCAGSSMGCLEPALRATHADGNTSTDLAYVSHEVTTPADGVTLTRIELKDRVYPFFVTLFCRAHAHTDTFELWSEIRHEEEGPVTLWNFASASPIIPGNLDTLTHFHGQWNNEVNPTREKLTPGMKIIESKRGVRATEECHPMVLLSGANPQENTGEVIGAALAWSGNFQMAFERSTGRSGPGLRGLFGMNPYASQLRIDAKKNFTTPPLIVGYSNSGLGTLSRNFHKWTRKNALRDGDKPRAILLNNWEATYFNFDEKKLIGLFDGAKSAGMEMFLLDDGWFGDKHPRNDPSAGLGDWIANPKKLPHGVEALTKEATRRGLRFGIWFEPEMVNPKSELFEKHPDWVLRIPKRPLQLERGQLVLDLCNPQVEEYVFKCVDDLLLGAPGVSYIKWDCNSHIALPYSPALGAQNQSNLYIAHTRALYRVLDRLSKKHPQVEMMLCGGGGGRVDLGALKYFQEFWPSDNTDPMHRVLIQHNYSYFFPVIATANHVTHMGKRPLKFAFDVAMSGRLGMDMDLQHLPETDRAFCTSAIAAYKTIRDTVQLGDQYRLENAQENGRREAIAYVSEDQSKAALMVYQTNNTQGNAAPVKLEGLDAGKNYRVKEINLPAGATSTLAEDGNTVSGKTLMETGIIPPCQKAITSAVFSLTAE